ncbi:Coiled-coil domain-containing protein 151 [Hondaea fermentalgiana]|uniref:Coiled-coil domain-containing protein 151 n=1 Tax=Hondaea fermentalgiana TaxID=2315210 RepID=A0A2R5GDZ3_9STRA|nr:Coiled-coil domain-containing protein 151 [Hondaea fermentalgiana]|eukprot:GBG26014.1 Coiled-coil domain-containing protein 151 [Hondaea fermentalgiana]
MSRLMGPTCNDSVTEAELCELRDKLAAMEADRRVYYENSMKTMKENKRIIASLREANKQRRCDLKEMRKIGAQTKRAREIPHAEEHADRLEQHVTTIRKNLDAITANVEARRAELKTLRDEAAEIEANTTAPCASAATPEQAKHIRSLENRLDRSIIKFNEANSIRNTYEQIVARLKEERDNFDAHFAAMEKTIKVKEKDLVDLETLGGDAQQAREVAERELKRASERLDTDRKQRERELRIKRQTAEAAADMVAGVLPGRHSVLQQREGNVDRSESAGVETRMLQANVIASMQSRSASTQRERASEALEHHEEAIIRIMKITGVSDVNEIVSKIVNQDQARANLEALRLDNADKIEEHNATLQAMQGERDRARFTGTKRVVNASRKRLDVLEDQLEEARTHMDSWREKLQAGATVLADVQAGIGHLLNKIAPMQTTERFTYTLNEGTVMLAVEHCDRVLTTVLSQLAADSGTSDALSLQRSNSESLVTMDSMHAARPYNQRVRVDESRGGPLAWQKSLSSLCLTTSRKSEGGSDAESGNESDGDGGGDDDDKIGARVSRGRNLGAKTKQASKKSKSSKSVKRGTLPEEAGDPLSRSHIKQASRIIVRQKSSPARASQPRKAATSSSRHPAR